MAYTAEISRGNPTCFVFLIDQSSSMNAPFGAGEGNQKKSEGVATAMNRLLGNIVDTCSKSEGIRDWFHVAVIGYGGKVGSAFLGALENRSLVPISQIADSPIVEERNKERVDDTGEIVKEKVKFRIWIKATSTGGTPMCQALGEAQILVKGWLDQHPKCFPPIIINITDGESTDGDPTTVAEEIRRLKSDDGEVLLFNIHLSDKKAATIEYPSSEAGLADQFAQQLFRMSSVLPDSMLNLAKEKGMNVSTGSRGFVFNADMVSVIKFLNTGTQIK
ncbi:MAG: VWA domain-containing protein [Limisphaerales bacterium]